ncbi:putative C-type lectin domain family 20 member A [Ascaphus truei]|uniref:putative C-type lectin domain family 20 member A n=1 Tax=Ascaphus truei TaxID=8439 RepID=UPI003F59A8C9
MTWEDARNYCRKNYVDLADIKDVSELAALVTNTLAFQTAWIGLYYDTATGSVRWSTGASYSWTPNILLTEGNCAAIYTLPLPAPCTSEKSFICLYYPEGLVTTVGPFQGRTLQAGGSGLAVSPGQDLGYLVLKVDFVITGQMDWKTAASKVVNKVEKLLAANVPGGGFRLTLVGNATDETN